MHQSQQDLVGRVALVTGRTTGIGFALAKRSAEKDAKLVLAARDQQRGGQAEEELSGPGAEVVLRTCDVTDPAAVEDLVAFVMERFGKLNFAVDSAAFDALPTATHEMHGDSADSIISTDVLGALNSMKYEIEAMLQRKAGPRHSVHHRVPGMRRLPPRAAQLKP